MTKGYSTLSNNEDFLDMFENKLCEYTGAPYAVAVDRCTNAILLALKYLKVKQITCPNQTYISVPMTCINYGIDVTFVDDKWEGGYQLGDSNVYDYAVGFEKNMYVPGQVQCLSFQQKKRLPIGKGGAILLDDELMYKVLRLMRHDGRNSRIQLLKDNVTVIGYHMNMSPDEAARGILLMNQLNENYECGSHVVYPDISKMECFK